MSGRDEGTDPSRRSDDPSEESIESPESEGSESESEWRFTLEDIERREAEAAAESETEARRMEPVEAGDPSLEGVVFVLLGVVFTLFVLSRLLVG